MTFDNTPYPRVVARIPRTLKDQFEQLAYAQGISAGEALRRAMMDYLARHENHDC